MKRTALNLTPTIQVRSIKLVCLPGYIAYAAWRRGRVRACEPDQIDLVGYYGVAWGLHERTARERMARRVKSDLARAERRREKVGR